MSLGCVFHVCAARCPPTPTFFFFFSKALYRARLPFTPLPHPERASVFGCALPVAGSVQPLPNDLTSIYDQTKAETERRGTAGFGSALKMSRRTRDRCQSSPSLYLRRRSRCSSSNPFHGGGGVLGDERGEMKSDSFLLWCWFSLLHPLLTLTVCFMCSATCPRCSPGNIKS